MARPTQFKIQTYNAISEKGLSRFDSEKFELGDHLNSSNANDSNETDAIILRSYKLGKEELGPQLRAVARAGAGVNNVPVDACTEAGIVVFNTPGANANAVKELVLCGMLLASRGIVEGIDFAGKAAADSDASELSTLMEQEKKRFKGSELAGKTLGVVGLGAIGSMVAHMAIDLGMQVIGYDPALSVDAAWRLPSQVRRIENLSSLLSSADFVSLHLPVLDSTRGLISAEMLELMPPGACLLNFARDEIVDSEAVAAALDSGSLHKYVCDFPRPEFAGMANVIAMPHIGASTREAEENCAIMAADQLIDFLGSGTIRNSVNFPNLALDRAANAPLHTRLAISNRNVPKMLGQILSVLADHNLNVVDMINKSRGEIAYNLIDLEQTPEQSALDSIADIADVIKVTLI